MTRTTLSFPDEMEEKIENEFLYGDSKSEWTRHSIKMRQHVNPILNIVYESYQCEEWLDFVKKVVRRKVDELKRENGK